MADYADFPAAAQIPVDLIIYKNPLGISRGDLTIKDAKGELLYKVRCRSSSSDSGRRNRRVVFDANNNPLISIIRDQGWQGFKGDSRDPKDLLFWVESSLHTWLRSELQAFILDNSGEDKDSIHELKVKGSPFQRSCTIYDGNSIIAQSSAMYKLHKVIVERHRFRLTIYPGTDHNLTVALVAVFFDGEYKQDTNSKSGWCHPM